MHLGSAALPVGCWIAMAVVGLSVCGWALTDALADLHYLQARGLNGAREMTARRDIIDEALRCGIQTIFLLIGVFALSQQHPHAQTTATALVVSGGLILAEAILIIKSIHDRRTRHAVIQFLTNKERGE